MRFRLLPESSPLGWTPYAWLVYLSFFLVYAYVTNSPSAWIVDGLALVAFLVLYFRAFWVCGPRLLLMCSASSRSGLITSTRNPARELLLHLRRRVPRRGRTAVAWGRGGWLVILAIIGVQTWLFNLPPTFWVPAVGHRPARRRLQHPFW